MSVIPGGGVGEVSESIENGGGAVFVPDVGCLAVRVVGVCEYPVH